MIRSLCPQCGSKYCGPYACRFTGNTHKLYRENLYAEAVARRDKEQPKWLRDSLTGARDPDIKRY